MPIDDDEQFFMQVDDIDYQDDINRLSPDWSDYVMTQFTDEELVNISEDGSRQAPNVAGLRRVTELVMGTILESRPINVSLLEGGRAAYAIYEVVIMMDGRAHRFGDAADYTPNNGNPFRKNGTEIHYATAMAVTRAEARALRKALKLRTVAAEEVDQTYHKKTIASGDRDESQATSAQINYMDKAFKKRGINGKKFVDKVTVGKPLTYELAKTVLEELQKYINGEAIPKSLQGYQQGWDSGE